MGLLVRLLLIPAGLLGALFVARDSPNFGVVQGMLATGLLALALIGVVLVRRR